MSLLPKINDFIALSITTPLQLAFGSVLALWNWIGI